MKSTFGAVRVEKFLACPMACRVKIIELFPAFIAVCVMESPPLFVIDTERIYESIHRV